MRAQRPDIVQGVTDRAGLLLEKLAPPRVAQDTGCFPHGHVFL